jgi:hypothetical protein
LAAALQIHSMTKELPRWTVSRIEGNKARYITTVNAKDAESAISTVVKDLRITNREDIKRLAARPG